MSLEKVVVAVEKVQPPVMVSVSPMPAKSVEGRLRELMVPTCRKLLLEKSTEPEGLITKLPAEVERVVVPEPEIVLVLIVTLSPITTEVPK